MRAVGEEERELLIGPRNEPDGLSVEVRDSGPGFAPAALERVFEAFYTTKPGGLGLGLSICRSIIEAHNGRLWASPNVPRGASFQFACRRSQTLRRDAALVSLPKEQATRPRVLLWVKLRRTQCEQMSSELPLKADIAQYGRHVS
jgi:signal transduction histidine kinase